MKEPAEPLWVGIEHHPHADHYQQKQQRSTHQFCAKSLQPGGSRVSVQRFTRFPIAIAIEVTVPLAKQLLIFGIGADLLAAVPTTAWGGAR